MKRYFLLLMFLLLVLAASKAQPLYKPGYLITYQNDTLHGYIDYKSYFRNLERCRFKATLESDYQDFMPDQIKAFRYLNSNYFVALKVDSLDQGPVFVEKLIDGVVDSYLYYDDEGRHFLIHKEGEPIYELKDTEQIVVRDGVKYAKQKKEYQRMLNLLFHDDPATIKKLPNITLASNDLISISEFYHNQVCNDYECLVYTKDKLRTQITFGILAGMLNSDIACYKNKWVDKLNVNFSSSWKPMVGFFINIMEPNFSERFSLQLELNQASGHYTHDSSFMKISYLKVPLLIRYAYPGKKISPAIQFGLTYNSWTSFEDLNIMPEAQHNVSIQYDRTQFGPVAGVELSYVLSRRARFFVQGRAEYLKGKHYNLLQLFGGFAPITAKDYVWSESLNFSVSSGIRF